MLAGKSNFFPRHVNREIGHLTQINKQAEWPFNLQPLNYLLLEFLEIGKRKLAEDNNGNPAWLNIGGNHDGIPD